MKNATTWGAAVVASGDEGTGPTLLLTCSRRAALGGAVHPVCRVAFNACEALQRVCKEHGAAWGSGLVRGLDCVLLTANAHAGHASHALGLPGVVLALSELGAASLRVRGPRGTESFTRAMGDFVRRKWPEVEVRDVCPKANASDDAPTSAEASSSRDLYYTTTVYEAEGMCVDARVVETSPAHSPSRFSTTATPKSLRPRLPPPVLLSHGRPPRVPPVAPLPVSSLPEQQPLSMPPALPLLSADIRPPKRARHVLHGVSSAKNSGMVAQLLPQPPLLAPPPSNSSDNEKTNGDDSGRSSSREDRPNLVWYRCRLGSLNMYVVDCPSPDWIERCVSLKLDGVEADDGCVDTSHEGGERRRCGPAQIVIHLSPDEVLRDPRYAAWAASHRAAFEMQRDKYGDAGDLKPLGRHRTFALQSGGLVFSSSARQQARLYGIDPFHFSCPSLALATHSNDASTERRSNARSCFQRLAMGAHVHLGPRTGADGDDNSLKVDESKCCSETASSLAIEVERAQRNAAVMGADMDDYGEGEDDDDEDHRAHTGAATAAADARTTNERVAAVLRGQLQRQREKGVAAALPPIEVLFLGTGSAAPAKLRGSSAIHLRVPGFGGVLLDAGEGTYGQLCRQFGADRGVRDVLMDLKLVWISHHHLDHQGGLLRVLEERARALRRYLAETGRFAEGARRRQRVVPVTIPPLLGYGANGLSFPSAAGATPAPPLPSTWTRRGAPLIPVVGPASVGRFLSRVASSNIAASFVFVPFVPFNNPYNPVRVGLMESSRAAQAGVCDLVSVPVRHCKDAYGIVLTLWGGEKIVYSGDTRPCDRLSRAGAGATLLIHEATFDDDRMKDAMRKRHSTVGEALGVARKMRARRTVLTHFSQRYPRIIGAATAEGGREIRKGNGGAEEGEKEEEEEGQVELSPLPSSSSPQPLPPPETWCVAFDGMKVRLSALPVLGSVASAARRLGLIRACFAKEKEDRKAGRERAADEEVVADARIEVSVEERAETGMATAQHVRFDSEDESESGRSSASSGDGTE